MRRAPDTIDPDEHEPKPGEAFAGGTIAEMIAMPGPPISTVTIVLTDGSVITYQSGLDLTWTLRDALLAAPREN